MRLDEAQDLAESLMYQHGLDGWRFRWSPAKATFGLCAHGHREIRLSKALVEINDFAQVADTILHEIAHALIGSGHGHDDVWKLMAEAIGAKPERCWSEKDTTAPAKRWVGVCRNCGHPYHRHRKPSGRSSCGECRPVGIFDPAAMLDWTTNPEWEHGSARAASHKLTTVSMGLKPDRVYHAECSCGWKGPERESGPAAAKTWMDHVVEAKKSVRLVNAL